MTNKLEHNITVFKQHAIHDILKQFILLYINDV